MVAAMDVGRFTLDLPLIPELISLQAFALVTPPLLTAATHLLGSGAKWVVLPLIISYASKGRGLSGSVGQSSELREGKVLTLFLTFC